MPGEKVITKKPNFLIMTLFFCLLAGFSYAASPQAVSLSPSSGTSKPNKTINFTATYSDADGRNNIHYAMFLVNRSVDGKECFYGYYLVGTNKLYLRNDANTAWLGGFVPGSGKVIENSYARLDCAKTRISGTGAKLAIRWNVTFKTGFTGLKNCYLYAKDKSGNRTDWIKKGAWRVGENTAPKVGTIIPDSGSAQPDTRVYFTTTFTDVDGYNDLQYGAFLINTSANGSKCFYAYYLPGTDKLYLRNDAGTAWLGGYAPKSNKVIRNSYAKLDCSKTTVSYSGTTLTIKWCVVFRSAFKGSKNCYLYAKDTAGARTAWEKKGTWLVGGNSAPKINSVTPPDQSTFLAGARVDIKIEATDTDNDPLEYQFSVGGAVKQLWSKYDTYSWQTFASDTGAVSVTCEVRDDKGSQDTKTISYQIINPTVEEVLEKLAANYAKIQDLTADLTLTSTLNGEPFGQTDYCKYYFKAPGKEKTVSFTDASRSVKAEASIVDGPNMYLIDFVNKLTQPVDLLAESGISGEDFNQMDLYYNHGKFLDNHEIIFYEPINDSAESVVSFDAIPKSQNSLYSKLSLLIDFNKGLLIKSCLYKDKAAGQAELLQTIETVGTKQMPNGAWVATKTNKIPVLTSGNLVDTAVYENIQLNTGLSDSDFNPDQQYQLER